MSSSGSSGGAFSFDTPQAVMHVLASVRKSDISVSDKNSLRDLVLSYTNGGKDPSLKIQIEQKLASLAVQPLPLAAPTPAVSVPEFGSSRNTPVSFTASRSTAEAAPAVAPAPQPVPVVSAAPVPPAAQPTPVVTPLVPPAVASTPEPVPPPVTLPPTPQAPAAPSVDNSAALARVREIKSIVNEKIGNPVNLVDIDNAVGREYMSALLDAMKKLSSGVNSASTMARLEASFAEVERVLEQPRPAVEPVAVAVVPKPAPAPVAPTPEPVVPPAPTSTPEPDPTPATPVVMQAEPVIDQVVPKSEPPAAPVKVEPVPEPKPDLASVSASEPEVKSPQPKPQPVSTPIEDKRWYAAAAAIKPAPLKSLSESATPLKSVADVPTQDSLTNKDEDPLMSQAVSEGLNQLLSDWMLFKKSGLFGTGPSGREHPLYQKIKDLQIPLLLAGRFEGATQEIKQSITDYMNGWRYEQGIIYEQGETFDHYLRRVIRHILDLQK